MPQLLKADKRYVPLKLFMRYPLLFFIVILFSCSQQPTSDASKAANQNKAASGKDTIIYTYNKDGLSIQLDSTTKQWIFQVQQDTFTQITQLEAKGNTWQSPHVVWTSDAYACILTYYSGQYGEYLFLPLKEGLKARTIKGGLLKADSVNHLIVYTDTVIENHYTLAVENLLTQKRTMFPLTSYSHDGYKPLLDTVIFKREEVILQDGKKEYRINLKPINGT